MTEIEQIVARRKARARHARIPRRRSPVWPALLSLLVVAFVAAMVWAEVTR